MTAIEIAAAYISPLPVDPMPEWVAALRDGGAPVWIFAYGSLMFWFAQLYARAPVRAAYAAGFVAMGIALEFIQAHVARDFEVADMVADAIGVALGWAGAIVVPLRFLRR